MQRRREGERERQASDGTDVDAAAALMLFASFSLMLPVHDMKKRDTSIQVRMKSNTTTRRSCRFLLLECIKTCMCRKQTPSDKPNPE